jgi:hypothetical protein
MIKVQAKFDGRVFIPLGDVPLPAGTNVEILLPSRPAPLTPQEQQEWQAILEALAHSEPAFPSLDEAMRHTRKRP